MSRIYHSIAMAPGSMPNNSTAMHTGFYWGKDVTVLFEGWPENSSGKYVLAFLFVLILGVIMEALSVLETAKVKTNSPKLGAFIQACVHTLGMAFAYFVVLAVMSYNVGIFIAALAGHGIGYFLVKARDSAAAGRDE